MGLYVGRWKGFQTAGYSILSPAASSPTSQGRRHRPSRRDRIQFTDRLARAVCGMDSIKKTLAAEMASTAWVNGRQWDNGAYVGGCDMASTIC